jgi:hypothetical protein
MNIILIVDNKSKTAQLYSAGLEAYVGAEVVEIQNIEEATEYIFHHAPNIVITRSPIQERDIGYKFHVLIKEKQLESNLIVIGKTKLTQYDATLFNEDVEVKEVIRACAKILGVTAKEMAEKDVGNYYPFKLSLILPKMTLPCTVYRRKNLNGKEEYVEFLGREQKLHSEVLSILIKEGDESIFVEAGDRLKFVNALTCYLSEMLADDNLSLEDSLLFANHGYKLIRESARKMMMTPDVIQMTENNINIMNSIVNRIPKLKEILALTTKDVNVMFRHSLLISFVATHIIGKMDWGNQEQKVKITFVAFFHDISLNNDKHFLIHTNEELESLNLSKEEKLNIERHALSAAKMLTKYYSNLPLGVETIIKQHHGARDGIGFNQAPMSISPLALVFMVAEEWVKEILNAEQLNKSMSGQEILAKLKPKFKAMAFQNIIKALEDLTV